MLIQGTAINASRRGGGGRAAHHLSACEDHQALGGSRQGSGRAALEVNPALYDLP